MLKELRITEICCLHMSESREISRTKELDCREIPVYNTDRFKTEQKVIEIRGDLLRGTHKIRQLLSSDRRILLGKGAVYYVFFCCLFFKKEISHGFFYIFGRINATVHSQALYWLQGYGPIK